MNDPSDRASEQRYRHLLDHMPIGLLVADLTVTPAVIVEANRRAELVYGYTASELVGMPVEHLAPDAAGPLVASLVERVRQGHGVTVETSGQRRDSTVFPVHIVAAPDPSDAGRMIYTVEDITADGQRWSEAEAIAAERRRIASEIHDGAAQSLAELRTRSASWSHRAEVASSDLRAVMDELQAELTAVIAARVLGELLLGTPEPPRAETLTEGEMAVLRLVAQGVDNQDIAAALNYSVHTVANRLRTIFEKLHVTNRTQAALYALRQGWVELDEPES